MSYRIAHFSDFHLSKVDDAFSMAMSLIQDGINQGADHLAITGDLVESGQIAVLAAFVEALQKLGWWKADRVTIIPGNHDIFPSSIRAPLSTFRRPTRIFEDFAEVTKRCRIGSGTMKLVPGEPYPFAKVLNNQIVVVGLDSTRNGSYHPLRWAEGELPGHHREAVDAFLEANRHFKHRVILMHHHPWHEEFEHGSIINQNFANPVPEAVEKWVGDSHATLLLCGHVHAEFGIDRRRIGKCRVLRAGTAGGFDDLDDSGQPRRIYHMLTLEKNGNVRISMRKPRLRLA